MHASTLILAMHRNHFHERIGSRVIPHFVIMGAFALLALSSVIVWKLFVPDVSSGRTTIVLAGDSMTVLSWDAERKKLGLIRIPGDVRVEGVYNTGQLSLASLIALEALDPGKSGLFAKSLSDALALPVAGVIRVDGMTADNHTAIDSLSPFRRTGWQQNGMDHLMRFRLWWTWSTLRPDALWTLNIADQGVLRKTTLPDGSATRVFDRDRFDTLAGSLLETDSIRREMRRVLIVNTTDTVGLGNRIGRMLGRAGMIVAAVENESNEQNACSVHAKKTDWNTRAMQFIHDEYGCIAREDGGDSRVDITVRLGKSNAKKYHESQ